MVLRKRTRAHDLTEGSCVVSVGKCDEYTPTTCSCCYAIPDPLSPHPTQFNVGAKKKSIQQEYRYASALAVLQSRCPAVLHLPKVHLLAANYVMLPSPTCSTTTSFSYRPPKKTHWGGTKPSENFPRDLTLTPFPTTFTGQQKKKRLGVIYPVKPKAWEVGGDLGVE